MTKRHNLSIINSYNYKKWNFSINYQFRSGLPFSEPTGLFLNEEDVFL